MRNVSSNSLVSLKCQMRECGNIHVFLSRFCISVHIFHEFLWAFKKLHRQTHSWLFLMKYFLLMQFGTEWSLFCVKPDGSYIQLRVDDLLPLGFHPAALQEERVNTWWCHDHLIVMSSTMSSDSRPNDVPDWWCHLLTIYDVIKNVMMSTDYVIRSWPALKSHTIWIVTEIRSNWWCLHIKPKTSHYSPQWS